MTAIEWESGGGVIQQIPSDAILPLDLPAGADLMQRNGIPELHVTLIGRKTLIGCDRPNRTTLPAGSDGQCSGKVNFSGPRISDKKQVLFLVDVFTPHQLGDQDSVDRWLSREVKRIQGLIIRKLGSLESTVGSASFSFQ